MKTRAVVIWFVHPVKTGKQSRTRLDLMAVVQESAAVVADRLLGRMEHPEDAPRGEIAQAMTEMVKTAHSLSMQDMRPTPGLRWVGECAEFQLKDGSLCLVPRDLIAWVELGPEFDG